jgi:hypothetical protein
MPQQVNGSDGASLVDTQNHPGGTLLGGAAMALRVITNSLMLHDESIEYLSHDPSEGSIRSVPSSHALALAYQKLTDQLEQIDPHHNFFLDNTVITLPLIPQIFSEIDDTWGILNWNIVDGEISYIGKDYQDNNFIEIKNENFHFDGDYFFKIDIPRLDSGRLELVDTDGTVLKTISTVGSHFFELSVNDSEIQTLQVVAKDVFPEELIVVRSINMHRITPRLKNYLQYLFQSGGGTGVTHEELESAIITLTETLQEHIQRNIQEVKDQLSAHLSESNPHRITPESIGAAAVDHTHDLDDLGAADKDHTHLPEEIGAAPERHTHTKADVGLENIPNAISDAVDLDSNTTLATSLAVSVLRQYLLNILLNKADTEHTHTLDSLGAAPKVHEHPEYLGEAQVRNVINEILDASGVGSTLLAPNVLTNAPQGYLPIELENTQITAPVSMVLTSDILHTSSSEYDYKSGVAVTSVPPIDEHPAQYGFKVLLTEEDASIGYTAFLSETEDLDPFVLVGYMFHTDRKISGYEILPEPEAGVMGYPRSWEFLIDNLLVETKTFTDPWDTTYTPYKSTLAESKSGKFFGFLIRKVDLLGSNKWMFRVKFDFVDVEPNKLTVIEGTELTYADASGSVSTIIAQDGLSISPNLTSARSPLYLLMSENEEGEVVLETSILKPEFSLSPRGYDGLTGGYAEKTNPYWGDVSVSDEDPQNPVENIYGENVPDIYLSNEGVTEVTITHSFLEPLSILEHSYVFEKRMLLENTIPNQIKLEYLIGEEYTEIELLTHFYPGISGKDSPAIWYRKKYPIPKENILGYKLTLKGTQSQTRVGLGQFILRFATPYLNIASGTMSPPKGFLGTIKYIESYDKMWSGLTYDGPILGRYGYIPVDHFNVQPDKEVVHRIPNPFNTELVDCQIQIQDVYSAVPPAKISEITDKEIVITTYLKGRYVVLIKRLW